MTRSNEKTILSTHWERHWYRDFTTPISASKIYRHFVQADNTNASNLTWFGCLPRKWNYIRNNRQQQTPFALPNDTARLISVCNVQSILIVWLYQLSYPIDFIIYWSGFESAQFTDQWSCFLISLLSCQITWWRASPNDIDQQRISILIGPLEPSMQ